MTIEVDTIYPDNGSQYFQVVYYSKNFLNKEMAKIHATKLKNFVGLESKRIKIDTKNFLKTLKGKKK